MLVDPEIGSPFDLYPAQERFLRETLTLPADGRLPYPELVFAAPKKSGKTATAALVVIYVVVVLGGPLAEAYCAANDLEQAAGRVFQAVVRILEASPRLRDAVKATGGKVEFLSTGATITALANDYASAAGGNPNISSFDELWGYTSERARRLWDEMVPPPTRRIATRLTVNYAGFEGESELLEELHKRGLRGTEIAAGVPCGRKAGGFVFHNTRHSALTNMNGAGVPDSVATTITGHRSLAIFKRYGIRQESVRRAAMEKVETYVRSLSSDAPAERRGVA